MVENRNNYLDGLRGIAAIIVTFYHYLLSFYPAIFTLQPRDSHTSQNIEASIGCSVFSFLFNGNFAVCLFFVLSGYVLSIRFFSEHDFNSPVPGALKRYFRLIIPISASVFLSYILLSLHGYSNIKTGLSYTLNNFWLSKLWDFTPRLLTMLKEGFIDSVIYGENIDYNPILWTMNIEFKGSLIVYAFLALFGRTKNRLFIYIILVVLFYKSYFLAFILGISLSDYRFGKFYRPLPGYITILLFLISLCLASFEFISIPPNSKWGFLDGVNAKQNQIWFIIASVLMLATLVHEKCIQNVFSANWLRFLGKISFSFYLLHLIFMGSFTCLAFNYLYAGCSLSYHLSFLIAFILSMCILIVTSYYYYKYIDLKGIQLANRIYERFFNETKL